MQGWISRLAEPQRIICDLSGQFKFGLSHNVFHLQGIQLPITITYTLQCNRMVERFRRPLKQALSRSRLARGPFDCSLRIEFRLLR
ncbi:hypothetical protein NPIL_312261 [Nephila pilipes]|uniref:Uncharacterized protein n=1 Tax=Nephila pilipes TaxID=299642 RepID=A0A8X6TKC3_NEPPI|nr:hypothetical protein NPIL_312261 [Nephila pilipes]